MSSTHLSFDYPVLRAIQKTLGDPTTYAIGALTLAIGLGTLGFTLQVIAVFLVALVAILGIRISFEWQNKKVMLRASSAAQTKDQDLNITLVNINQLADRMQNSLDANEDVLLLELKLNQSPQVARLMEHDHIKAEENLTQEAAKRIKSEFAEGEVFRLGKSTYLLWLPGKFFDQKRRIEAFSQAHSPFHVNLNGSIYYPKLNIGITELSGNVGESITRLELACDKAFQSAGANCYFVGKDNEEVATHIAMRKGLREVRVAIHEGSLGLYAQPTVPISREGTLPKYELLLRHFHQGEVQSPWQILQRAEYNQIMHDVDLYVVNLLAQNFHQTFGENGESVESVAINISGDSYTSPRFKQLLVSTFHKYQIPPEKIVLEVTENIANNNIKSAVETMEEMKSHGFRLALDDIGVGSSNFKNLFLFPVDYFKIDRSYCETIGENEAVRAFVKIVVDEAIKQGKQTIAEGVPDFETLQDLEQMGVNYSQSFITGEPQPMIDAPMFAQSPLKVA
ncbi:MAG: EAL domain-containing protein [Pseudomonadales bacterium]|nr:EAL domain-containing protein [Pseudomonadales bacterium]